MKKIFLTIALVFITCLSMFGQTINVINPKSSNIYRQGGKMDITWLKAGSMNELVNVYLFNPQGTEEIFKIVENETSLHTPVHDPYEWTIPYSISPGHYKVRVTTIDGAVSDDSEVFDIRGSNNRAMKPYDMTKAESSVKVSPIISPNIIFKITPRIKVIQPSGKFHSRIWYEGKLYYIKWNNKYTKSKSIKIDLYNSSGMKFVKNIKTIRSSSSIGSISKTAWMIRKGEFNTKNKYRIKISRRDNSGIFGLSDVFTIGGPILGIFQQR